VAKTSKCGAAGVSPRFANRVRPAPRASGQAGGAPSGADGRPHPPRTPRPSPGWRAPVS